MKEYIAELHLRALETSYELDAESETRLRQQVDISHEIEDRKSAREDAIKELLRLQPSR
jgi:hypothetical protein